MSSPLSDTGELKPRQNELGKEIKHNQRKDNQTNLEERQIPPSLQDVEIRRNTIVQIGQNTQRNIAQTKMSTKSIFKGHVTIAGQENTNEAIDESFLRGKVEKDPQSLENSFDSSAALNQSRGDTKVVNSNQVSVNEENENEEEEDDDLNSIDSDCADELLEFYGELAHKSVKLNKDSLFVPGSPKDEDQSSHKKSLSIQVKKTLFKFEAEKSPEPKDKHQYTRFLSQLVTNSKIVSLDLLEIDQKLEYFDKVVKITNQRSTKAHSKLASMVPSPLPTREESIIRISENPANTTQKSNGGSQKIVFNNQSRLQSSKKGLVSSLNSKKMFDEFVDEERDTPAEVALKMRIGGILSQGPDERDQEDLEALTQFMTRYKFFSKLKKNHDIETVHQVMRYIKVTKIELNKFLIQQGEDGDRFYVILKGTVGVQKAYNIEVPYYDTRVQLEFKIFAYLQCLLDNFDNVFWQMVPYTNHVKKYLQIVMKLKSIQENNKKGKDNKFSQGNQNDTRNDGNNSSQPVETTSLTVQGSENTSHQNLNKYLEVKKYGANLDEKLLKSLCKLSKIFDFSQVLLNRQVAQLKEGTQFGELALINSEKRQASIVTLCPCYLTYLDQMEYQKVLHKAQTKDIQKKMNFMKQNRFFEEVSSAKLHKLSYLMKQISMVKGHVLYCQGEIIDGIYLVESGHFSYVKQVDYKEPIQSKTQNKWFVEQAKQIGIQNKKTEKMIGSFDKSAIIGFEEIFRDFILGKLPKPKKDVGRGNRGRNSPSPSRLDQIETMRDFKCVCSSRIASVMFLPYEILMPIMKMHDQSLIEQLFRERRSILQPALQSVDLIANYIAGTGLKSIESPSKKEKNPFKSPERNNIVTTSTKFDAQTDYNTSMAQFQNSMVDIQGVKTNNNNTHRQSNNDDNKMQLSPRLSIQIGCGRNQNVISKTDESIKISQDQFNLPLPQQQSMTNRKNEQSIIIQPGSEFNTIFQNESGSESSIVHNPRFLRSPQPSSNQRVVGTQAVKHLQGQKSKAAQEKQDTLSRKSSYYQQNLVKEAQRQFRDKVAKNKIKKQKNLEKLDFPSSMHISGLNIVDQQQQNQTVNVDKTEMSLPQLNKMNHRYQDQRVNVLSTDSIGVPKTTVKPTNDNLRGLQTIYATSISQDRSMDSYQNIHQNLKKNVLRQTQRVQFGQFDLHEISKNSGTFTNFNKTSNQFFTAGFETIINNDRGEHVSSQGQRKKKIIGPVAYAHLPSQKSRKSNSKSIRVSKRNTSGLQQPTIEIDKIDEFEENNILIEEDGVILPSINDDLEFVYAQDQQRENIIDERSVYSKQAMSKISAIQKINLVRPPAESMQGKYQTQKTTPLAVNETQNEQRNATAIKDTTRLYLKDLKSFMNLRNASINFDQRKNIANNKLVHSNPRPLSDLVEQDKTSYHVLQQIAKNDPKIEKLFRNVDDKDKVNQQLTLRLLNVMQSFDTDKYYMNLKKANQNGQIEMSKETEQQMTKRMNMSLTANMNQIDQVFEDMHEHEVRNLHKQRNQEIKFMPNITSYKKKTRNNIHGPEYQTIQEQIKKSPQHIIVEQNRKFGKRLGKLSGRQVPKNGSIFKYAMSIQDKSRLRQHDGPVKLTKEQQTMRGLSNKLYSSGNCSLIGFEKAESTSNWSGLFNQEVHKINQLMHAVQNREPLGSERDPMDIALGSTKFSTRELNKQDPSPPKQLTPIPNKMNQSNSKSSMAVVGQAKAIEGNRSLDSQGRTFQGIHGSNRHPPGQSNQISPGYMNAEEFGKASAYFGGLPDDAKYFKSPDIDIRDEGVKMRTVYQPHPRQGYMPVNRVVSQDNVVSPLDDHSTPQLDPNSSAQRYSRAGQEMVSGEQNIAPLTMGAQIKINQNGSSISPCFQMGPSQMTENGTNFGEIANMTQTHRASNESQAESQRRSSAKSPSDEAQKQAREQYQYQQAQQLADQMGNQLSQQFSYAVPKAPAARHQFQTVVNNSIANSPGPADVLATESNRGLISIPDSVNNRSFDKSRDFNHQQQHIIKDMSSQYIFVKSPDYQISSAQAESYGGRQEFSGNNITQIASGHNFDPFNSHQKIIKSGQGLNANNTLGYQYKNYYNELKGQTTTVQNLQLQSKFPMIKQNGQFYMGMAPNNVFQQVKSPNGQYNFKKNQSAIRVPNYYGMRRENMGQQLQNAVRQSNSLQRNNIPNQDINIVNTINRKQGSKSPLQ